MKNPGKSGSARRRILSAFAAVLFFAALSSGIAAEPLYSPTWGFWADLPTGYEMTGGDGKNRFSFFSHFGTFLDIAVYTEKNSAEDLAVEIEGKLSARGARQTFVYNGRIAVLSSLEFPDPQNPRSAFRRGWALYLELPAPGRPVLFVLSYGAPDNSLEILHLSALDSIAGGEEDRRIPGPVTEFSCPAGNWKRYLLTGTEEEAWFREGDAEAAQALIDREFAVLRRYADSRFWREAWKRFYRAVYRDSFDRLKNAAFILERSWNPRPGGKVENRAGASRRFAERALSWIQNFRYERDLMGSDFVNLVSAAQEGRGDCDSRAMLWAIILEQADIPAAIMVSREFGHAMGLADLEGEGARFSFREGTGEYRWIVAETTAKVKMGLIGEKVSETSKWLGIAFEH